MSITTVPTGNQSIASLKFPLSKRNSVLFHFLLPALLSASISGFAQEQVLEGRGASQYLEGATKVRLDRNGRVKDIHFDQGSAPLPDNVRQWILDKIDIPEFSSLELVRTETDQLGYTHYRYQHAVHDIPIEGGIIIAHVYQEQVVSINGYFFNPVIPVFQPAITEAIALQKAMDYTGCDRYLWENAEAEALLKQIKNDPSATYYPQGQLTLAPHNMKPEEDFKLCYRFDIYGDQPRKRNYVYVDAATGEIVASRTRIHSADAAGTAVTKYSGTQSIIADSYAGSYRLRESGRGGGIWTLDMNESTSYGSAVDFTDADNYWNNVNPQYDEAATDAHWGAEKTYDYYFTKFGRSSFDAAGATIVSYVHYDNSYSNAFWDGSGVSYGDGGSGSFVSPLTALEICAHEITHGVTEFSAGLYYEAESGALNEAFSDMFGVTVEKQVLPASFRWRIGWAVTSSNTGIRDMSNPNIFGDPDTYQGTYWTSTTGLCDEFNDYCGVHSNSGVANYWFYLLSTGGSGINDLGNSYAITGIGMDDAAAIAYRTLTNYLGYYSDFSDARYYSIQAATDLFGACANQVFQTTNAWYAVGLGNASSTLVNADFTADKTFSCSVPTTISFTNSSVNGTTYLWNFGDGTTSTATQPNHTYTAGGTYTISLIATGSGSCGSGKDTLIRTDYITITNSGAPIAASCTPTTTGTCCGYGITHVTLDAINNTSGDATEGYQDFTCSASARLTALIPYNITVRTSLTGYEDVRVWIDYDNSGTFNTTTELAFSSDYVQGTHSGTILVPGTAVLNTPIRMRVASEYYNYSAPQPCINVTRGQFEDYTVFVLPNTNPPVADFTATPILTCDGTVSFKDTSGNLPGSWFWEFGDGTTSTLKNPMHLYNADGIYDIQLITCNSYGCDTLLKNGLITVSLGSSSCDTILIPGSGDSLITTCSGNLMDSGGEGNYFNSSNGIVTISPPGANYVTLTFSSFQYASSDYLYIYDGPSINSPLMAAYSGSALPNGGVINSTGSSITLRESTTSSTNALGFFLTWTSSAPAIAPVANFSVPTLNPPLNVEVEFTNLSSSNSGNWIWDFGDGSVSHEEHPKHTFVSSGAKTVSLFVSNCFGTDTLTRTISVQPAPGISVWPDTLRATVLAGDSTAKQLFIANQGGELWYNIAGASASSTKEILAITYGVDLASEYPHTLTAINQYYTNYNLTEVNSTDATVVGNLLNGKNLVLIPEMESGTASLYSNLASVLQNFVNHGGAVIFCGSGYSSASYIFGTGLFAGSYQSNASTGSTLSVLQPSHPILQNVTTPFTSPNATFYMNFTNTDIVKLVTYSGYDVVSYRDYGLGKVIYVGFDFYTNTTNSSRIISNAIQWAGTASFPNWLSLSSYSDSLLNNDTTITDVWFNATGLTANQYTYDLLVQSNDLVRPTVTVPCVMDVVAFPVADFKADRAISCNGEVNFMDQSLNNPTSYLWHFGDGGTSNQQNPTHTYLNDGGYDVMLIACNSLGCDTLTKTAIINVLLGSNQCDTFLVPNTGSVTVTTCSGNLLDSGGNNNYLNSSNGTLTIAPPAATQIRLEFTTFNYASGDYLYVYDGPNTASPQIGYYTGTALPNGGVITSTGGTLTLREYSTSSTNSSGFVASWTGTGQPIPPLANFYVTNSTPPLNTSLDFFDLSSSNSGNWMWDFGDGGTSNLKDPSHTFITSGNHVVTLTVSNCYGSDTISHLIQVQQPPGILILPDSFHVTLISGDSTTLPLAVITTGNGSVIYNMYGGAGTAYDSTSTIIFSGSGASTDHTFYLPYPADTIKIIVTVNGDFDSSTEYADLYIDGNYYAQVDDQNRLNIDVTDTFLIYGPNLTTWLADDILHITLKNTTSVASSSSSKHKVQVITSGAPWLVVPSVSQQLLSALDTNIYPIFFDARQLAAGTYYSHIFVSSSDLVKPVIIVPCQLDVLAFPNMNFRADKYTTCDGLVNFFETSLNNPTSFFWEFGDGGTSTLPNPSHAYTANGSYDVTIIGCNGLGCDTLTKPNFISVTLGSGLCDTLLMPTTGIDTVKGCSGNIYDSGGNSNYFNSSNGYLVFAPPAAISITVNFSSFNYAASDYLYVYDGPNTTSPLIGAFTGTALPNGGTITSSGGYLTLREYTSSSTNSSGFSASWIVNAPAIAPVANFTVSDTNPAFNTPVSFNNLSSSNSGSWFWDFGDGFTSTAKSPIHAFMRSGNFQVSLTVFNCFGADSVKKSVTVMAAPAIIINPDSFFVTLTSGDSTTRELSITNLGGPLQYQVSGVTLTNSGTIDLLALTYGVDLTQEYVGTKNAINQYFTNYNLTELNTTVNSTLQNALVGKEVLLIAEQETGLASVFSGFSATLINFVSQGGTVIFCATDNASNAHLFNTGLFSGSYNGNISSGTLTVVDPTDPIMDQVPSTFSATNATFYSTLTNTDIHRLVTYSGYDVVSYRNIGSGKAIYLGFDFYAYNSSTARIVANAVSLAENSSWLYVQDSAGILLTNDTVRTDVKFDATGLNAGVYTSDFQIASNHTAHSIINIPCELTVTGIPMISLSDTVLNFGSIMQGTSSQKILSVWNPGTDTLFITNMTPGRSEYTLTASTAILPPGDSVQVPITFSPTAIANYDTQLFIYNNSRDTTVHLTGVGTGAPSISVMPSSLLVNFTGCNDTVVVTLDILNNGLGNLNWQAFLPSFFTDDFDPNYQAGDWVIVGGSASSSCGSNSGTNALYFNGSGTRTATTKSLNTLAGGTISFSLKIGSGSSPCENADTGEDIILEFSTNGSTWTTINTYYTSSYSTFTPIQENIPVTAQAQTTQFRWRQISNSGSGYDNWAIDDISIGSSATYQISPSSGVVLPAQFQTVTLTFTSSQTSGSTVILPLNVTSSDPVNPVVIVPCTLTVAASPCVAFVASPLISCDGTIQFTDNTSNNPAQWTWNFGDGSGSALQNPSHTYTADGTYSISLIACNVYGCDTLAKTNYITVDHSLSNCGDVILTNGQTLIANSCSGRIYDDGGPSGNYSNNFYGTVIINVPAASYITLSFTSFQTESGLDEVTIYDGPNSLYPQIGAYSGSTLPIGGLPILSSTSALTLTFITDGSVAYSGFAAQWNCISANSSPVADFNFSTSCNGAATFTDISTNLPTSWSWNFGDGTSSILQNSTHTYLSSGVYTVSLTACNAYGCDTKTKSVSVNRSSPVSACIPLTPFSCCGFGIQYFSLNTISKQSQDAETEGYQDFSCQQNTQLILGQFYPFSITVGPNPGAENIRIWIDLDNNGVLDSTEMLIAADSIPTIYNGIIHIPASATTAVPLRMRVSSFVQVISGSNIISSCDDLVAGQAEDYSVTLLPLSGAPVADFTYTVQSCGGKVNFSDNSLLSPDTWWWDFGDGLNTSTIQNPANGYSTPGTYLVTLISSNSLGTDTVVKTINLANIKNAHISISDDTIGINQVVTFYSNSAGITSWHWDFGGLSSSSLENPSSSFSVPGIYAVILNATDGAGCQINDTLMIEVLNAVGLAQLHNYNQLLVYPNPVGQVLYVDYNFDGLKDISMEIANLLGEKLWSLQMNQTKGFQQSISIVNFASGLYLLKVYDGEKALYRKIVKP